MTIDNMSFDNSRAETYNSRKRNRAKTRKTNFKKKNRRAEIANRHWNPFSGVCCNTYDADKKVVGTYIKFAGSSAKKQFLKRQTAKKIRKTANVGNGNQYQKHYEYWWNLY